MNRGKYLGGGHHGLGSILREQSDHRQQRGENEGCHDRNAPSVGGDEAAGGALPSNREIGGCMPPLRHESRFFDPDPNGRIEPARLERPNPAGPVDRLTIRTDYRFEPFSRCRVGGMEVRMDSQDLAVKRPTNLAWIGIPRNAQDAIWIVGSGHGSDKLHRSSSRSALFRLAEAGNTELFECFSPWPWWLTSRRRTDRLALLEP